jgi:monomeric isocitrate dehydrogenase
MTQKPTILYTKTDEAPLLAPRHLSRGSDLGELP